MFHDKRWGTVCDTNWNMEDAHVVCKELGFSRALRAPGGAHFGEGSGPILMNNVTCDYATHLSHCQHSGWYQTGGCSHANDAGVVCDPGMYVKQGRVSRGYTALATYINTCLYGPYFTAPLCEIYLYVKTNVRFCCRSLLTHYYR